MEASVNDIRTYYIDVGNPKGLPIVMVHGMTFDHQMWLPQVEALKSKYRVIVYDLRGHGKSDVGDGQYTHRQFADDLVALLDYLNIDRAVLCGLSMGGAISLRTVGLYPDRVRGLILCDTTSEADADESKAAREKTIQSIKKEGLKPFADQFIKNVFAPESFTVHAEVVESVRNVILSSSPLGICGALLSQAARINTTPTLSKIRVPTLLLFGEKDRLTPVEIAKAMRDKIPGSQLRVISEAAHVSNLENPEEFNKHLLKFLEKIG